MGYRETPYQEKESKVNTGKEDQKRKKKRARKEGR
jgi:hypothetical protein